MTEEPGYNAVEAAIAERRSVRAFRPDPVDEDLVRRLLDVSSWAPSGTNMQPWRAHALAGEAKDRLSRVLLGKHAESHGQSEYKYYPETFFEPYLSRRRKVGWDMYGILGIQKGDTARMHQQTGRNFLFFDAPVGIVFTIDRRLEIGSWLDYGMFLQNVMVAARSHGLETCVQAAFSWHHGAIREALGLPEVDMIVCGMSLGYPDAEAPVNRLRTERSPAAEFATFAGWGERG